MVVIGKGWKIISKIGIESKTVPVVQGCITAEAVRPSVFKIVNYQNMNFVSPICAAHKSELTFAPPCLEGGQSGDKLYRNGDNISTNTFTSSPQLEGGTHLLNFARNICCDVAGGGRGGQVLVQSQYLLQLNLQAMRVQ